MNAETHVPSSLRRMTRLLLVAVLMCACSGQRGPTGLQQRAIGRFDSEFHHYLQFAPHKSLALAGDVEGRFVIGYGFDEITVDAAESAAISDCELRRRDKRIEDPCRIVAVDDERVEGSISRK